VNRIDRADAPTARPGPPPVVVSGPAATTDSVAPGIDARALRAGRLARTRAMMREKGYAAVVLFDPNNQRYATGSRNMFGYFLRNSTRYVYVPVSGPVILFEYPGSAHVSTWLETIDEARNSQVVWAQVNQRDTATARPFAQEIAALVREHAGLGAGRVGLDRCTWMLAEALLAEGCDVADCQADMLYARRLKTPEEIASLAQSVAQSEAAVDAVEKAIAPGVTETELFAVMYGTVIAKGSEMIETRLLSSGPRTNPWFNEASDRQVRPGELIALDTDTIGCNGYYADFSRTFVVGDRRPTGYQQSLYRMAHEQIHANMDLLRAGVTFRELAERAWPIPERFDDRKYPSIIHGVGLHGETPLVAHADRLDTYTGDGVLEAGMTVSVESYIGEPGGTEGVKLEEQVVITETGVERFSRYPFDDRLLDRQV